MNPHDPFEFILTSSGRDELGEIPHEVAVGIGYHNGPIKLQRGFPGPKGYGFLHVEKNARRMQLLSDFGFGGFLQFCEFVAQHYDWIGKAKKDRLIIVREHDGYDFCLFIEHKIKGTDHWSIVTGLPKRISREEKLWVNSRMGGSEPTPCTVEKRIRFETLSLSEKTKSRR
ncbi:MAG: hypothetical protein COB46_12335 [Rhodospirillaceae bacterium]|nr:MAG: hypothetical protein COB46_12335 [Rhodospirillaceae bacterium]